CSILTVHPAGQFIYLDDFPDNTYEHADQEYQQHAVKEVHIHLRIYGRPALFSSCYGSTRSRSCRCSSSCSAPVGRGRTASRGCCITNRCRISICNNRRVDCLSSCIYNLLRKRLVSQPHPHAKCQYNDC